MGEVVTIAPESKDSQDIASWHAVLVVEGVRTSDGREFAKGSIRWRTLPIPLMWQQQTSEGHKGSVVAGRIDRIERIDDEIHGWGTFDLGSENGREAHRLVSEQIMRGVSVDAELMQIDKEMLMGSEDGDPVLLVEEGRLLGATIVAFPAFPQAVIALDTAEIPPATEDGRAESLPDPALVASPDSADDEFRHFDTTFKITDRGWDSSTSRFTDAQFRRAAAGCRGSDAPPKSDCFLPHHEPDGTLNRNAVHNAASRFNQTQAPSSSLAAARRHLASHYTRDLKEDPPKVLMQLALVAHAEQQGPPATWFENPDLKGPTPLTIARNGRVYGHAALWNACHTGYKECMRPPRSRSNYSHFLLGAVFPADCDCEDGIPTGPIVLSTNHADGYAPADTARRHYDHTGLAVADVTIGEDDFGIWIAGSLRPGVSEAQIRALRGSSLSGDWRYIGGNMELISILAVNTPGFPIPRVAAAIHQGVQVSLVAAGIPEDTPTHDDDFDSGAKPADLLEQLKREREEKAQGEGEGNGAGESENGNGEGTATPEAAPAKPEDEGADGNGDDTDSGNGDDASSSNTDTTTDTDDNPDGDAPTPDADTAPDDPALDQASHTGLPPEQLLNDLKALRG